MPQELLGPSFGGLWSLLWASATLGDQGGARRGRALVLWPVIWLLALPFRLVGIGVGAAFAFVKAVLYLPARMLGMKP